MMPRMDEKRPEFFNVEDFVPSLRQAELEAIMGRVERSCRTFSSGPGSRNHVGVIRSTLGQEC